MIDDDLKIGSGSKMTALATNFLPSVPSHPLGRPHACPLPPCTQHLPADRAAEPPREKEAMLGIRGEGLRAGRAQAGGGGEERLREGEALVIA